MAGVKTVADIMTTQVVTVFEEDNLRRVRDELGRFPFRHLPVVDDGKLVGMLSERDVLHATMAGIDVSPVARAREARFLEETFVRDLMRTELVTIQPEDTVQVAAKRMVDGRIGALPVVDTAGMLLGIVTENDILRVVMDTL